MTHSYCFVRTDLLGPVQTVQAGHAWWQAALELPWTRDNADVNFVLIGVESETELAEVAKKLTRSAIPYKMFYEKGPPHLGFTALATPPLGAASRATLAEYETMKDPNAVHPEERPV